MDPVFSQKGSAGRLALQCWAQGSGLAVASLSRSLQSTAGPLSGDLFLLGVWLLRLPRGASGVSRNVDAL